MEVYINTYTKYLKEVQDLLNHEINNLFTMINECKRTREYIKDGKHREDHIDPKGRKYGFDAANDCMYADI